MGLDMYLSARKYIGGRSHMKDTTEYQAVVKATGMVPAAESPSLYVSATVGYWRKANAIHAWFVKHTQDGVDDGRNSYVSRKQLEELRTACNEVLDSIETVDGMINVGKMITAAGTEQLTAPGKVITNKAAAERVLPTQGGFFFGSTDYDEGYIADLRDTVRIIDRVLTDKSLEGCDFEYRASW
jgi:hypothetical protein